MDHRHKVPEYYLNSGDLLFSANPCVAKTVLGSCVSVVLWDEELSYGGLCHYLLPTSPEGMVSTKYADVALPYLLGKFHGAGSRLRALKAWIVGGSLMLDAQEIFFVGDRNVEFAQRFLDERSICVIGCKTGGSRARKLVFHTHTGKLDVTELAHKTTLSVESTL